MIESFVTAYFEGYDIASKVYFNHWVENVKSFYPDAKLYAITNKKELAHGVIPIYSEWPKPFMLNKFKLFNALPEPFMYLDCDVVLKRPFEKRHLVEDKPFNCFAATTNINLNLMIGQNLGEKFSCVPKINAGVIWVSKPSQEIVDELQAIQRDLFTPRAEWMDAHGFHSANDEYAESYYIRHHDLDMDFFPEVNKIRWKSTAEELVNAQSVHYSFKSKGLFFSEVLGKDGPSWLSPFTFL